MAQGFAGRPAKEIGQAALIVLMARRAGNRIEKMLEKQKPAARERNGLAGNDPQETKPHDATAR